MEAKEHICKYLRIKKDNEDRKKVIEGKQNSMNSLGQLLQSDENLYCLTTGVKVVYEIKDELLVFVEKGKEWHSQFVTGCLKDE